VLEITQLLKLLTGCQPGEVTTASSSYTDERPAFEPTG
jgi:hypothetical protein